MAWRSAAIAALALLGGKDLRGPIIVLELSAYFITSGPPAHAMVRL